MATKHKYTILLLISFIISCHQERFIINRNVNSQIQNIREVLSSYSKEYPDLQDYYIIIFDKKDTVTIFLGSFTSKRSVGFLDPFALFKYKGKSFYIFSPNGLKWGNDPSFHLNKPDLVLNDYPIWLITIKENKHIIKKGVRGYFSPPLSPAEIFPEFRHPVVDSSNLR